MQLKVKGSRFVLHFTPLAIYNIARTPLTHLLLEHRLDLGLLPELCRQLQQLEMFQELIQKCLANKNNKPNLLKSVRQTEFV